MGLTGQDELDHTDRYALKDLDREVGIEHTDHTDHWSEVCDF